MRNWRWALGLGLLLAWSAFAQLTVPRLTGPVVDQAGVLSPSTRAQLDQLIRQNFEQGGAQLQVATLESLGGLSIEQASIQLVDAWKLGSKKEDRGVLLVIAPNDRQLRIEVGQGLEGDLPDAVASRIVREVITPQLRSGDIDRAVLAGALAILQTTDPQLQSQAPRVLPTRERQATKGGWLTGLIWLIILISFIARPRRRGFLSGAVLGGLLGGSMRGGGGSGGGWSGGGGGFSGGGSSGSW